MKRKQLAVLFVCNLIPYIVGNAIMTFLPVYAAKLGGTEASAGIALSISFIGLTLGTLASGWLSDRFQRRKLLYILCGLACIPAIFLVGQAHNIVLMTIFISFAWFFSGMANALVNILTGLFVDPDERGSVFGVIGTSLALGQVIGGVVSGFIVDHGGFAALCTFGALVWIAPIFMGMLLEDKQVVAVESRVRRPSVPLSGAIWILIGANVLASVSNFSAGLLRPIIMDHLGFNGGAIASVTMVSGLVMLPLPFVVGWLSDRIGRRQMIIWSYLLSSVGALVLMSSLSLWQFWLSTSLLAIASGIIGVGLAYITDIVPSEAVSGALARYSATPPLAGVFGYAGTGLIVQVIGLSATFVTGAALPLFAVLMMLTIRRSVQVARA